MKLTIDQALRQGVALHREGKPQEAAKLYRAILEVQPSHPDANHNLGVLTLSLGKASAALVYFAAALKANPKIEQFWLSYIDTLIRLERIDLARQVISNAKQNGVAEDKLGILKAQIQQALVEKNTNQKSGEQESPGAKPDQDQLDLVIGHYQSGRLDDAELLARSLTESFPNHEFGWKALGAVLQRTGRQEESVSPLEHSVKLAPRDAEAHYNLAIALQGLDRLNEAEACYLRAVALKPEFVEAHSNLGNTLKQLGRFDEAEVCYSRAIELRPDYGDAHYNLANTLNEMGRLEEAEASYVRAIAADPDFTDAHNNLGNTLRKLGRLDEAERSLGKSVALRPDYAEAHYNLAICQQALGKLSLAELSYAKAGELHFDTLVLLEGIASLMQFHVPSSEFLDDLIKIQENIQQVSYTQRPTNIITDDDIINLINCLLRLLENSRLKLPEHHIRDPGHRSQIYRRNATSLNCDRHKAIFNSAKIIPEFCFGCYKVEITPRSFVELLKLYWVFDQIELPSNNTRKCFVELRDQVPGFYKGLIYCASVEEAFDISDLVSQVTAERLQVELPIRVKRGCSEYSLAFPTYKNFDEADASSLKYDRRWSAIETDFDARHKKTAPVSNVTLPGISLMDVLIIRNWVRYAQGIEDSSVERLINCQSVHNDMYQAARRRKANHIVTAP